MIQKEYTNKQGEKGIEYRPEDKDEVVSNSSVVYVSPARDVTIKKGTPKERTIPMTTIGIYATWKGLDIFLKLTKGQKKNLDLRGDLLGKVLVFENYKNEAYNKTFVGVGIKK